MSILTMINSEFLETSPKNCKFNFNPSIDVHKIANSTIQNFVNQHKIVFDVFFIKLSKIRLHRVSKTIKKLKDHCGTYVMSRNTTNPHISTFYVKERRPSKIYDRTPNLRT